jgi:hypothetical protein
MATHSAISAPVATTVSQPPSANFSETVMQRMVTQSVPPITWILVSHGHFDHLDKRSLKRLSPSAAGATPPGVARFVPPGRFKEIVPLGEWQSVERDGVRVTAVPVRHGDGLYGVDGAFRRGSHTGFVVEHRGPVYTQATAGGIHEVLVLSPEHANGWDRLSDEQARAARAAQEAGWLARAGHWLFRFRSLTPIPLIAVAVPQSTSASCPASGLHGIKTRGVSIPKITLASLT